MKSFRFLTGAVVLLVTVCGSLCCSFSDSEEASRAPKRPEMSKEVEQDYDALLDRWMPLAEKWLREQDGFVPCGAAITTGGEMVGHMAGPTDANSTEDVLRVLFAGLRARAQAGEIRATIVCFDGGLDKDGEFVPAIVIVLEHAKGPAVIAHRPHRRGPDGTYEYAQTEVQETEPEVFVGP